MIYNPTNVLMIDADLDRWKKEYFLDKKTTLG
jgi:hypothetical protein